MLHLPAISFTWATLAWGYLRWLALTSILIAAVYAVYSSLLTSVLIRYHRIAREWTTPPSTD